MVIQNDNFEFFGSGVKNFKSRSTAVDGYDKVGAKICKLLKSQRTRAVSFFPFGDMDGSFNSQVGQKQAQDGCGSCPVNIVVANNADFLMIDYCFGNSGGGFIHIF